MGILEIVLLLFIILKVIGVITWSWAVVLIPLYLMIFVYGGIFMLWVIGIISMKRQMDKMM